MNCPRCGSRKLAPQVDRESRTPVVTDGKLMLRCYACNEVFIIPEAAWDRLHGRSSRWSYFRIAVAAGGAFISLATAVGNWLCGLWVPWQAALACALVFGLLGGFEIALQRTMLLKRWGLDDPKLEESLGNVFGILCMAGFFAFMMWMAYVYAPRP